MSHINIDGEQNVEVSRKIPCEKSIEEQLNIMIAYTNAYKTHLHNDKSHRELACLKVIYPRLFRSIEPDDRIAGRLDFLPIGFGSVTSLGGVGHYCVFHKLRAFKAQLQTEQDKAIVDQLYDFWQDHDVKTIYCQDILNDTTTGRFIDCTYPFMATARLSGMMLNYEKLVNLGLPGLFAEIQKQEANDFIDASIGALYLLEDVIDDQIEKVKQSKVKDQKRMINDLIYIKDHKPKTFHQALQLFWLYALCAGCINYGRLDIVLGPFLQQDLDNGTITWQEAYEDMHSLWTLIENR